MEKKNFKTWSVRIEKDGDGRYVYLVARTLMSALKRVCESESVELDDIVYASGDPIDVVEE